MISRRNQSFLKHTFLHCEELEKLAIENAEIKSALAGMKVSKVVTVAPKLVNFVV